MTNLRAHAALYLSACYKNQGLIEESSYLSPLPEQDRALFKQLCYGVYRAHPTLEFILSGLLNEPLRPEDIKLKYLLMVGIYQLKYLRVAEHAAIYETVEGCIPIKQPQAKGLVNGCLRRYQREQESLEVAIQEEQVAHYAHPDWIIDQIQQDHPTHWQAILEANNSQGPLALRVNQRQISTEGYLELLKEQGIQAETSLHAKHGIILHTAMNVDRLPGFKEGLVSVQDLAAQLAPELLELEHGMHVLDACAAPGGKAAHCLETHDIKLLAVDSNQTRLRKVAQNFERLHLKGGMLCADATRPNEHLPYNHFDRILLDAPCSASGVIRRHPDIKVFRTPEHVEALNRTQGRLIRNVWKTLKPGGILVYATCSMFKSENDLIIESFIKETSTAELCHIDAAWGHATSFGRQILPNQDTMDGFYYAKLQKSKKPE